jgi:hypothetical protein
MRGSQEHWIDPPRGWPGVALLVVGTFAGHAVPADGLFALARIFAAA